MQVDGKSGLPVVEVRGHIKDPFDMVQLRHVDQLRYDYVKITHCRIFSDDDRHNWIEFKDQWSVSGMSKSREPPDEYGSFKRVLELVFNDFIFDESSNTWIMPKATAGPEVLKELCTTRQWEYFRDLFRGFLQGMPKGCGWCAIGQLLELLRGFITTKREHVIIVENIGGGSTLSSKRSLVFYVEPNGLTRAANTKKERRRVRHRSNGQMSTLPVVSENTKSRHNNTHHKTSDSTDSSPLNDGYENMSKSRKGVFKKTFLSDVVLVVDLMWHLLSTPDGVLLTVTVKHGLSQVVDSDVNQLLYEMLPVFMKFNVALGVLINSTEATMIRLRLCNGDIRKDKTNYYLLNEQSRFDVEQFSRLCVDIIHNCQQMYDSVF